MILGKLVGMREGSEIQFPRMERREILGDAGE